MLRIGTTLIGLLEELSGFVQSSFPGSFHAQHRQAEAAPFRVLWARVLLAILGSG